MLTPVDNDAFLNHIVRHAKSVEGLSAWKGDPAARRAFEELLGPPPIRSSWDLDRPFSVHYVDGNVQTVGLSTCGLVVRGIWYRAGVDIPHFLDPYEPGSVFTELINHAQRCNAWFTDPIMRPGWIWIIGKGLATHACVVIGRIDDNVESIDGGQVDSEHGSVQCVKRCLRSQSLAHTVGCIDPTRMPRRETCEPLNSWWYRAIDWVMGR